MIKDTLIGLASIGTIQGLDTIQPSGNVQGDIIFYLQVLIGVLTALNLGKKSGTNKKVIEILKLAVTILKFSKKKGQ